MTRTPASRKFLTAAMLAASLGGLHRIAGVHNLLNTIDSMRGGWKPNADMFNTPSVNRFMQGLSGSGCACMRGLGAPAMQVFLPRDLQASMQFKAAVRDIRAGFNKLNKAAKARVRHLGELVARNGGKRKTITTAAAMTAAAALLAAQHMNPGLAKQIAGFITPAMVQKHQAEVDLLRDWVDLGDKDTLRDALDIGPTDTDGDDDNVPMMEGVGLRSRIKAAMPSKATLIKWAKRAGVTLAVAAAAAAIAVTGKKNPEAMKKALAALGPTVATAALKKILSNEVPEAVVKEAKMTFQNPLFDPTAQPTPADTTPGPVPRPLTAEEEVHKQNLLRQLRELQERHRRPVPPQEEGQTGGSILSKLPSRAKLVAAAKKAGVAAAMVAAVLLAKYGVDQKRSWTRNTVR